MRARKVDYFLLRNNASALRMAKEPADDFRWLLQSFEEGVNEEAEACFIGWFLFGNALLEVIPALFVGVELRRIRGRKCNSSRPFFDST